MKNKIYMVVILLFSSITAYGQAPGWLWAKSAGGSGDEYAQAVATDAAGNVYAGGGFSSPSFTLGSTTLTNNGMQNMFLAKYDPNGNVIWAVSAGNEADDGISSIAADNAGYIYITGWFTSDTITFGTTMLINQSQGSAYEYDLFIAKYDSNGNPVWAQSAGGYWDDTPETITADASGNVYLGGSFGSDSITFGSFTLHNFSTAWYNLFIVKYDGNGNVIWARGAGGNNTEVVMSVAVNNSEEVYITGAYSSSVFSFDGVTINGTGSDYDMFIFKLDSTGTAIWGHIAAAMYGQYPRSISVDSQGNAYVTGYYESHYLSFGPVVITNTGGNSGTRDIFLVKYNSSGSVLWARGAGGTSLDECLSVSLDAPGNPYLTGGFNSASLTIGTIILTNAFPGESDIFLAKYDTSGYVQWAKSTGGTDHDSGISIKVNASGEGFAGGFFSSPSVPFSPVVLTNADPGTLDLFVAKFDGVTGIPDENIFSDDIHVFPNPVTDKLYVTVKGNEVSEIILYDVASKKLMQQFFKNSASLNTEELAEGIYIYEVRNHDNCRDGLVQKGKVIKSKTK